MSGEVPSPPAELALEVRSSHPALKLLIGERGKAPYRVRAIISNFVGQSLISLITDEAELDDLEVDPLDRLGITCAIDEAFLIEISDADEEAWRTVGDVVATV